MLLIQTEKVEYLFHFLLPVTERETEERDRNNEKEINSGWIFLYSKHITSWTALLGFRKENTACLTVLTCKRTKKLLFLLALYCHYTIFVLQGYRITSLLPENGIFKRFCLSHWWVQVVFSDFQHRPGHSFPEEIILSKSKNKYSAWVLTFYVQKQYNNEVFVRGSRVSY